MSTKEKNSQHFIHAPNSTLSVVFNEVNTTDDTKTKILLVVSALRQCYQSLTLSFPDILVNVKDLARHVYANSYASLSKKRLGTVGYRKLRQARWIFIEIEILLGALQTLIRTYNKEKEGGKLEVTPLDFDIKDLYYTVAPVAIRGTNLERVEQLANAIWEMDVPERRSYNKLLEDRVKRLSRRFTDQGIALIQNVELVLRKLENHSTARYVDLHIALTRVATAGLALFKLVAHIYLFNKIEERLIGKRWKKQTKRELK